tara:strand:+ start:2316 stop:2453 length:138 start_codon:yes stop_codon:yes gene_type:complete
MNQQNDTTQIPDTWQPKQGPLAKIISGILLLLILCGLVFMAVYAW